MREMRVLESKTVYDCLKIYVSRNIQAFWSVKLIAISMFLYYSNDQLEQIKLECSSSSALTHDD